MNDEMLIRAERKIYGDGVDIHIALRGPGDGVRLLERPALKTIEASDEWTEPCLRLKNTDAQRLMDELWNCGLRPSEGSGSAGSLAATQHHLKDMQTIAMGLLKKYGV